MANDIFIGVDGGGTKCKIRVEDDQGNLVGQAVGGPANIRLSVEQSWACIYGVLQEALEATDIHLENKNYRFHLGLGLAGCEASDAYQAFLTRPHGFTSIQLTSDAHVACLGAHKGKDGAIIIVGTGTIGYQIQHGKGMRVGGWGFPQDDEGSGAWLGLEAARLTFQWLDHRAEKSPLVEDIFAFFNNDLEQFATWANRANSTEFARLAPFVINHSQQEEITAVRLMKKAAHAVDRIEKGLVKMQERAEKPLGICLFGGLAPFIEPWLSGTLLASLTMRQGDANTGAILMMRQYVSGG